MNKIALITGASAGIGRATAIQLAEKSFNIIVAGRRKDRLTTLVDELKNKGVKACALCFDIQKQNEVKKAIASLDDYWKNISLLVNNAGLAAGLDPVDTADINDWETMIDTNIKGLLYISKEIIPIMISNGDGHIINIGSIAGKETYANGSVYCATKSAVDAISKGMRIDLLSNNIRVTTISPGMVETEFSMVRFKGDTNKAAKVYEGLIPLHPEDVADAIVYAATRPPHVTINEMLIMPTAQAGAHYVKRG